MGLVKALSRETSMLQIANTGNHGCRYGHHLCILIRSNKIQQYAGIYLLQNHSTCFGCPSHPSSGVHQTVTAASVTGHITNQSNNLPNTYWTPTAAIITAMLEEGCCSDTMTCTRDCSYSFMYS